MVVRVSLHLHGKLGYIACTSCVLFSLGLVSNAAAGCARVVPSLCRLVAAVVVCASVGTRTDCFVPGLLLLCLGLPGPLPRYCRLCRLRAFVVALRCRCLLRRQSAHIVAAPLELTMPGERQFAHAENMCSIVGSAVA